MHILVVVQSLSHLQLFMTPWTAARQALWSFTISWSLLKLMSIELIILSSHLILCHPLLLLPSIFPRTRVSCIAGGFFSSWATREALFLLILGKIEGNNRRQDGWMASLTQWTGVWASSGRWWRTAKPGKLQSMGSQRVRRLSNRQQIMWYWLCVQFVIKVKN